MSEAIVVDVIIAEPNSLLRIGIRSVLDGHPDIVVKEEIADPDGLPLAVRAGHRGVALVGLGLLRHIGEATFRELRRENPACRILVHSYEWHREFGVEAARFGVSGYFSHECSCAELSAAVLDVAAGKPFITRGLAVEIAEAMCFRATGRTRVTLSARERQVLRMLTVGLDLPGIAAQLGISVQDAADCKWRIAGKMDVVEAGELVRHAVAQASRDWPRPEVCGGQAGPRSLRLRAGASAH
jgi:DNA-binding NarL/FixJ family response regulator